MFNYWALIFILPQEVIDQMNKLYKNYLWGGRADYQRSPLISWHTTCTPRKYEGMGLKNLGAWNKACIAKIIWFIAMKKDILWVKQMNEKYLKQRD